MDGYQKISKKRDLTQAEEEYNSLYLSTVGSLYWRKYHSDEEFFENLKKLRKLGEDINLEHIKRKEKKFSERWCVGNDLRWVD